MTPAPVGVDFREEFRSGRRLQPRRRRRARAHAQEGGDLCQGRGATCFDHNSSKSTNFSASRLSLERSRGDKAVGALLKNVRFQDKII